MSIEITDELIATFSPEAQAVVRMLMARIDELEAKLNTNSKNSSKPPSSQHPHAKPDPPKKKSKRKRGGQPGHDRYQRELVPADACETVITRKPPACRGCGKRLRGSDKTPLRKQIHDVEIRPIITEYQLHRLTCRCGMTTCGTLPDHIDGETGPTLAAILVLMTSWFRTSRAKAATFSREICGVPCSKGHVSELEAKATAALSEPFAQVADAVAKQPNLKIDETPFKRGGIRTWLWTFVAGSVTLFALRPTRKATVLVEHLGENFTGSINCDRAKMYFQFENLQWCWSHLKRDFQAMIDSKDNTVRRLGHDQSDLEKAQPWNSQRTRRPFRGNHADRHRILQATKTVRNRVRQSSNRQRSTNTFTHQPVNGYCITNAIDGYVFVLMQRGIQGYRLQPYSRSYPYSSALTLTWYRNDVHIRSNSSRLLYSYASMASRRT